MTFTFIHTADWQLGKPFGRFSDDVSARLTAARLDAIERIGAVAGAADAAHVLVAGDVFDSERAPDQLLRAAVSRMAGFGGLSWHLLPGNHDPARPGGIWGRLFSMGLPDNVKAHVAAERFALASNVALLPAPLTVKETLSDPTAWMDGDSVRGEEVRIALAHGSVRGFDSLGEAAVPIDAQRRRSARLDYLALGDWHGTKSINEGVWYSGTPEPDSFGDNDPGNVLVVRIAGPGATPTVDIRRVGEFSWSERRLVMSRLADLEPVERHLAELGPRRSRLIMSLVLEGSLPAGEEAELSHKLAEIQASVAALEVNRRGLRTAMTLDELEMLGAESGGVADVARELLAMAQGEDARSARIATRAAALLFAMAAPGQVRSNGS